MTKIVSYALLASCLLITTPSVAQTNEAVLETTDNPLILVGGNIIEHHQGEIGEEKITYDIYQIKGYTDMEAWFKNNFSADTDLPVHYLNKTLYQLSTLDGESSFIFKTIEHNFLIQNILVEEDGNTLTLYRISAEDSPILLEEFFGYVPVEELDSEPKDEPSTAPEKLTKAFSKSSPPSSCQNNNYKFGAKIGEYNGVPAYSNCKSDYVSDQTNSTGIKWQCVEYAARYFKEKFNRQVAGGNATYCANASSKGLNRTNNDGTSTDKPQPGNIICSNGGKYGHCAIVRAVDSKYVYVIQQNFNNSDKDQNHKLSLTKDSKGRYKVGSFSSSYPVACWMWPK